LSRHHLPTATQTAARQQHVRCSRTQQTTPDCNTHKVRRHCTRSVFDAFLVAKCNDSGCSKL
jgi:hypothetical protein